MAIKKKTDVKDVAALPAAFDQMLKIGFTQQFLSARYDDQFKDTKKEVLAYIAKSDEIEITQGEGFKCPYGSIILSERSSYDYDKENLAALVESGKLTVEQLLGCVSTFKAEDMIKTLSQKVFDTVATKKSTDTFTFKATSDFKAKCESEFAHDGLDVTDERSESARMADEAGERHSEAAALAPMTADPKLSDTAKKRINVDEFVDKTAKAKTLAAKVSTKSAAGKLKKSLASVDDDIDAILKDK